MLEVFKLILTQGIGDRVKISLKIYLGLLAVLLFIACFPSIITEINPNEAVLSNAFKEPSSVHLFGTDKMGRDLFARVIYGARTSVFATGVLVLLILGIGGTLGAVAGYVGGTVEAVIMRLSDMMVSFPGMALALALAGVMTPSLSNAVSAITMVSWTKYARLSRSLVKKAVGMEYVHAARISGARDYQIIIQHLLPSMLPTLVVTAAADMGGMMLELAAFSFLGLGATATSIEWGYMLNEGRESMLGAPWLMLYPGLAIFITVVIFNLLGDAIRDHLDVRSD